MATKINVEIKGIGIYSVEAGSPEEFYPSLPGAVYEVIPASDDRLGAVFYLDAAGSIVEVGDYVDREEAERVGPQLVKAFKAETNLTAGQRFIEAWEVAGRPQVQEIKYPSHGNATHRDLSHGDVLIVAAMTCPMEFKREHGFVEINWKHDAEFGGDISSWSKLIFEEA